MIKPVGDWYLVLGDGNEGEMIVLEVPDTSHWPCVVGDRVMVDTVHLKPCVVGNRTGRTAWFIHRNYILGVVTDDKGE